MGVDIKQDHFAESDYVRFEQRLQRDLEALERLLARPGFGAGAPSIGAELEMFLIDQDARPSPVAATVVEAVNSPLVTPELGAFSIETSTPPVALAGSPFGALRAHLRETSRWISYEASLHGARTACVGVLPTFRRSDFTDATISPRPRYRALSAGMKNLRGGPFNIRISGAEPLDIMTCDIAMEAANIAFQLHIRVAPEDFARTYNAAMMLTGPVLAAAANSPTFLGHRLWRETRVPLFEQAGDDRRLAPGADWAPPSRIGLGTGWVRAGALELFRESVALHAPLLPVCGDEDPLDCMASGGVPELRELCLHHGTVWKWNRPVYDRADGGHLRIELRALPSGPTIDDMLANAAMLLGCILALAPEIDAILPSFPFALAERNFLRAAQFGLDAELAWPMCAGAAPDGVRARDLLLGLAPRAAEGLLQAGVNPGEVERYLDVFQARVRSGITGAVWQERALLALESGGATRREALRGMFERYLLESASGRPVHTWAIPAPAARIDPWRARNDAPPSERRRARRPSNVPA